MNEPGSDRWSLSSALRAVAADDEGRGTSPAVEARLLAELRVIARARQRRTTCVALAAAAVLFIAVALPVWQTPTRTPAVTGVVAVNGTATDDPAREVTTAFFPLEYSNVPAPGSHLVRLQVPRAALARFEVPSFDRANDGSSTVLADVVVGNDGLARAVRFVRFASSDEAQEQEP
jgi:hypothetical protein